MTVVSVPALETEAAEWPTLGPLVCAYIETFFVFGPGDLEGQRARLDDEKRAFIYRAYEVYPQGAEDANGKSIAGRRRFRRVALVLQKGSAKTELAAWIAGVELAPDSPIRCDGFDAFGRPVGRPLPSPYIPMVAYTEEQSEDLAYAALYFILQRSKNANLFDIGLERIARAGNPQAKAVALAGAPDSRDGALTTFSHKDETHRWDKRRLITAHRTMLANLTKRMLAEPWELETTTAWEPGAGSVAEQTAAYANEILAGKIKDPRLFYFHRHARDGYDLSDPDQLRAAVLEAAGPTSVWKDINGICDQWQDPEADFEYLERVFLNKPVASASKAFNVSAWRDSTAAPFGTDETGKPLPPPAGRQITTGFDGSINNDSTAYKGTDLETGFQWIIGLWEKPGGSAGDDWEVDREEVKATVRETHATYDVVKMFADPSKWTTELSYWAGDYGAKVVVAFDTTQYRRMAVALKAYAGAIAAGDVPNDGDPRAARHLGNAHKLVQNFRDDDDSPLWLIRKDQPNSPNKIDDAMAGALSWAARNAAIAEGLLNKPDEWSGIAFGEPLEDLE